MTEANLNNPAAPPNHREDILVSGEGTAHETGLVFRAPLRERRPHRTYVTDPDSQSDRDGNRQGNVGPPHRHVRRVRLAWYRPDRCAASLPRTRYRPVGNRETHIAATPRRQGIAVRSSVGRSMPSGFSRAASQSCAKTIRSGSIFNRSPGAPPERAGCSESTSRPKFGCAAFPTMRHPCSKLRA